MIAPAVRRRRHPLALRLKCRKEWVEGQGTLAEVATREGVPVQTLVSWYRRDHWSNARRRWIEKQLSETAAPTQPGEKAENPEYSRDNAFAGAIARLERQLEAVDNLLDEASTAEEWNKLSGARQRLFNQWRILVGLPSSGSRRPERERPRKRHTVEPLEEAEPDPPAPPQKQAKVWAHAELISGPNRSPTQSSFSDNVPVD